MWDKRCAYVSNHDGDSVTVLLDQGFGDHKLLQDGLRLDGVYAPELSETGGAATRDFTGRWFAEHAIAGVRWPFICTTRMNASGTRERVTFGRYVGTITAPGDLKSLNDAVNDFVIDQGFPRGTGFKASA